MQEKKQNRLRSIVGGSIGNLVEWYDWYAYSAFAVYFAPVFFPRSDPTAQLLDSAAIFAVGFFMRTVGGWFFGSQHRSGNQENEKQQGYSSYQD